MRDYFLTILRTCHKNKLNNIYVNTNFDIWSFLYICSNFKISQFLCSVGIEIHHTNMCSHEFEFGHVHCADLISRRMFAKWNSLTSIYWSAHLSVSLSFNLYFNLYIALRQNPFNPGQNVFLENNQMRRNFDLQRTSYIPNQRRIRKTLATILNYQLVGKYDGALYFLSFCEIPRHHRW